MIAKVLCGERCKKKHTAMDGEEQTKEKLKGGHVFSTTTTTTKKVILHFHREE